MSFKKAEKKKVKLKLAVTGPSGAGKTYSSLILAKGLGKSIAVIDTENGSASLYSDKFDFDVLELSPPYSIEKYKQAINDAIVGGYDVLIIDSISPAWSGEGGLLQEKEKLDSRGGGSFQNWAKMTPKQESFISSILHSPIHTICTIRSKSDYIVETNDRGKAAPKKVGLAPIQRDGIEYEFSVVFDIALDHSACASKDRTGLFNDRIFRIDESISKELTTWTDTGTEQKIDLDKVIDKLKQKTFGFTPEQKKEFLTIIGVDNFDQIQTGNEEFLKEVYYKILEVK